MSSATFTRRSRIPAPAEVTFDWHRRPGALERLLPPWESITVVERTGGIEPGARVVLKQKVAGLPVTWVAEHVGEYIEGRQFRDRQIKGPFAKWEHTHRIEPDGPDACWMEDQVEYQLPGGPVGRALDGWARTQLDRMFDYRHATLAADLALHQRVAGGRQLTVAVTGSHGLIGEALLHLLTTGGHHVRRIVRSTPKGDDQIGWSPRDGRIESDKLEGIDAVVHLAGENIMGRWTEAKKQRIRDSRVLGTRTLAETLAKLDRKPAVLVNASAVGYYGDRGDELLEEGSAPGDNFLAEVCVEWESATQPAQEAGIRVAMTRFGVVLTPKGGALAGMLTPFRLGVGGPLGAGDHWWSWATLDDTIGAIYHAIGSSAVTGPVNVVAPESVTNRQFTRALGRVLRRPTLLPVPRPAARLAFGQLADEGMFASTRVRPAKLERTGYLFRHPQLEPALRKLLGR